MKLDTHIEIRSYRGHPRGGDAGIIRELPGGKTLLALIDATGHGLSAYHVAQKARVVLIEAEEVTEVEALFTLLHEELRGTAGAAISLALIERGRLTFAGVGNVQALLDGRNLISRAGVLGHRMRGLQPRTFPFLPGHRFIMHTDGVSAPSQWPERGSASTIAKRLIAEHGKAHDDAGVLVVEQSHG